MTTSLKIVGCGGLAFSFALWYGLAGAAPPDQTGNTKVQIAPEAGAEVQPAVDDVENRPAEPGPAANPGPRDIPVAPGWVQREVQFSMPMVVPEGFPMPTPPAAMMKGFHPHPHFAPHTPDWVRQQMAAHHEMMIKSMTPPPIDPGSLNRRKILIPDGYGGQVEAIESTWTSNGTLCREIAIHSNHGSVSTSATITTPGEPVRPEVVPNTAPEVQDVERNHVDQPAPAKDVPQSVQPELNDDVRIQQAPSKGGTNVVEGDTAPVNGGQDMKNNVNPSNEDDWIRLRQKFFTDRDAVTKSGISASIQGTTKGGGISVGASTDSTGKTTLYRRIHPAAPEAK